MGGALTVLCSIPYGSNVCIYDNIIILESHITPCVIHTNLCVNRPVNLLVMTPHRFVYAAIFGAMAGDLIFYIYYQTVSTGGFLGKYDDPYLNGFLTGG